jgi:aminopeptidase N
VTTIIVHELAHQWFGDWVTPARWSDIWLNEGFATWAEWLWSEHLGEGTISQRADATHANAAQWRQQFGPVLSPTELTLFSPNQYGGAGIVVEALRRTIGDGAFEDLLHQWLSRFGGRSVTTDDFVALAEEVSGRDLDAFFDSWLHSTELPAMPPPVG